jgi:hypothetical protein
MKCIAAMNTKRMRYLAALLFCITLLPACAARSEDWEVRVINGDTGKPEPGVMVLHWRTGRTTGILGNYSGYCDNEHIAVTDEQGMVKVPRDITGTPWRYAIVGVKGYFSSMVYKRGMADAGAFETEAERAKPSPLLTKDQREKEPNLLQILTVQADTRAPINRAAYLFGLTRVGCTCTEIIKAMISEAHQIFTPPPNILMQGSQKQCQ